MQSQCVHMATGRQLVGLQNQYHNIGSSQLMPITLNLLKLSKDAYSDSVSDTMTYKPLRITTLWEYFYHDNFYIRIEHPTHVIEIEILSQARGGK